MSERTYEFEATCEATVRETWRATVPANLIGEKLIDHINHELYSGLCEFVAEKVDGEGDREIEEDTIREVGPQPEPTYTITGFGGKHRVTPYTVAVHTHDGPEAALDLAHAAYVEAGTEGELQPVAIFAGAPRLIDFDKPETWPS